MPYSRIRGRKPFERASKIAHTEILSSPMVLKFVEGCVLPAPPPPGELAEKLVHVPDTRAAIRSAVAIDGGLTETWVREDFPSASLAYITLGPLLLNFADLADLDRQTFIGPEDMQRLKRIERYSMVLPTRAVRAPGARSFAHGVRKAVHDFLIQGDGHLAKGLSWLLFRGWRPGAERDTWVIPRCPNASCENTSIVFSDGSPYEQVCVRCGEAIYLADALRLYERIDEELGAGSILSYLLTALEQIVLVHVIRAVWEMKPSLLREVLFVKDGPLAFFGVTAPLHQPMRDLMSFLAAQPNGASINLVGVEKSGPFVEHAAAIEGRLRPNTALVLGSDYIYRHIVPGDPAVKEFGRNTYYGAKVVYRGDMQDTYVASIPTAGYRANPDIEDLINGREVLRSVSRLRCSMYDNALVPVVLANRLVSLADVPSSDILKRFSRDHMGRD